MIALDVRLRQGDFLLDASLTAQSKTLALYGPSGAGKTTLLNIIAGLTRPDEGRVIVDGVTFLDTSERIDLSPRQRRVGYVFQELRLFPHLRVAKNLLYGRRFAPRGESGVDFGQVDFGQVIDLLGIGSLLDRWPARLSGGEKQRVAIGRALLANPRLLLLDEPLAALDEARRAEILTYIEKLRDAFAIPIVFVSHRRSEVERLAGDVAVIEEGKLVEMRTARGAIPSPPVGEGGP
jgi:molybdate transport system ATP-binding protein